ncbi:N-acetylmuramoyl-L-alanine amidase family protein [Oribacterium sinus]|uniref:N-acetylmuramoyl-L-alanine amidase family protein n=1 Tax=Oribacterium sinus TaxID=237576 RepID=UPI0028EA00ED|nr:N-acetylmuramoyl-L-alanine amidase family protein [Oribacterium sinus]
METRFGKLMGRLLFLCTLLCLWGSSIAYAEEKVQSGFILEDEEGNPVTDALSFILEDSKGGVEEHQSTFGYLVVEIDLNKVYTLYLKDNKEYSLPPIKFVSQGEDPIDPETGKSIEKLSLRTRTATEELPDKRPEEKVSEGEGLDSIIIHTFKDDELLANSPFRLFRFEGHIPTVVFGGTTDEQGEYSFRDFRANSEYIIMMENPKLKFDKDSVNFQTNESGKIVKINGKTVQTAQDGEITFRGYEKNSDKLATTEVEFYVVDKKTQTPVQDVELTANTLVPRLSSYQNAKSDKTGRVVFHLEGQEGGKIYSVCVSKNAQFLWRFEPEQITIHVDEKGELTTEGDIYPIFYVTKEDRRHLRDDLEGKITEAKKYLAENTFSKEDAKKKLEQAIAAAREELDKPETIPFYVEGFIKSIDAARANLEQYVVKEEKKEEPDKTSEVKKEKKEEPDKTAEVKKEEQKDKNKEEPDGKLQNQLISGQEENVTKKRNSGRRAYRTSSYTTVQMKPITQKLLLSAGNWVLDSKGWWYKRTDGTYPKAEWLEDKGKWYFFDQEGYMKKGWVFWKEKWYYFGENGDMLVNTTTPDGYKVDKEGVYIA